MKIAVTGATGYAGGFIVDRLLADGHSVRAMVRPQGGRPRPDVKTCVADLDPASDYTELLRGADALIHLAFHHLPGRYRHGEGDDLAGFLNRNVAGSLALMEQARRSGVSRTILFSSRAVYGHQAPGAVLSEDMAVNPDSHYGAAKAALEAFAASYAHQDGWPVCALRPTGIYGLAEPVHRSKWFDLVGDLIAGRDIPVRGGTEVHGADVAEAVVRLLQAPAEAIAGRAFNCSDLYLTTRDIAMTVRSCTGLDIAVPDEPEDRAEYNVMDCGRLKRLGVTFSGRGMFERTIAGLLAHHLLPGAAKGGPRASG